MSPTPPGPKGTSNRIGFAGYDCACAVDAQIASAIAMFLLICICFLHKQKIFNRNGREGRQGKS
jgi:hypothetical protein